MEIFDELEMLRRENKRVHERNEILVNEIKWWHNRKNTELEKSVYKTWREQYTDFDLKVVAPWFELNEVERMRQSKMMLNSWRNYPPSDYFILSGEYDRIIDLLNKQKNIIFNIEGLKDHASNIWRRLFKR